MYGLMKAQLCSRHREEADLHRLHYCGTCKTMGRLYGQKSRFLLNNDAVFLSELLTLLASDQPPAATWERAYQSYNCFALPDAPEEMPLSLQVAASATLVMIEFKLADQVADAAKGGVRIAQRVFSQNFLEAAERLKAWGFPIAGLWEWYRQQGPREAEVGSGEGGRSAQETLAYVAEPTAAVTGLVFQHGAATVGAGEAAQQGMYALGFAFGSLVYTLDALEDYEKDTVKGDFNAFRAAYRLSGKAMPEEVRETTVTHLQRCQAQVEAALRSLPLPEGQVAKFATRLKTNLFRRLGLEEAQGCSVCAPQARPAFRERGKAAVSLARMLSAKRRAEHPGLSGRLTQPFDFLSVLGIALLLPRQAQAATSSRECREMASNLMVLGGALQSLFSRPARWTPAFAGASGGSVPVLTMNGGVPRSSRRNTPTSTTIVKVRRRGPGCCDGFCEGFACGCCEGCACNCCESCACGCCEDMACCECGQCCGDGCCACSS